MKNLLVDNVFKETLKYLENMPKSKRKEIGQFFTSIETARYMASMFSFSKKSKLSVLDAGSGSGILTAGIVERIQEESSIQQINITCYETNEDILPILNDNLNYLKRTSKVPIEFEIKKENYITSQSYDFNENSDSKKYDWIIGNPPYKKISRNSIEALSMPDICYGTPNLYFLFTAMGLFNLDKEENHESLVDLYASKKIMTKMPVKVNGIDFTFSPGKHNELQKSLLKSWHHVLLRIVSVYMLEILLKRI